MMKIKKFFKRNFKFMIGLMVGILLAGTSVYAANTYNAKDVLYNNTNSGLTSTNVQDAIDELYNKYHFNASTKIMNLYYDGSNITTVNIGGDSEKPKVSLNSTQGIILDDNGDYRYYGNNPNNYVIFNEESWRIIGVFLVDDGTGKKEARLKLRRSSPIGNYSYDSSDSTVNSGNGVNDWSKSDLMTELNTLYYNSQSGVCYNGTSNASTTCDFSNTSSIRGLNSEARSMIGDTVYYLGGSSVNSDLYANDYYNFERGTSVSSCSSDSCGGTRATSWVGKVAIMYPSDHMYATDLSICTKVGYNSGGSAYDYRNANCKNNEWLLQSSIQWTIAPFANNSNSIYYVYSDGGVNANAASGTKDIWPVVYLKSNIAIVSGEGTSEKPYQLKIM